MLAVFNRENLENQEKHVKHMQKTMGTTLRVLLWVGRKDLPSLRHHRSSNMLKLQHGI